MKNSNFEQISRETAQKYADILNKSRPDSALSRLRHPRMAVGARAKIFAPFAALRGYEDLVQTACDRANSQK